MKYPVVYCPFLPMSGMALFPFILVRKLIHRENKVLMNHEKIHMTQQAELLLIGFYLLYILNYLLNLIRYKNHNKAYMEIIFEKEAYNNEGDLAYLQKRKFLNWLNFDKNNFTNN